MKKLTKQELDRLKYLINKRASIEEICAKLNVEIEKLYEMVMYLKKQGGNYDIIDSQICKITPSGYVKNFVHHSINEKDLGNLYIPETSPFTICLLSDVHYGSTYDRPDIMVQIYEECKRRGVTKIFCCGDLTNGNYVNRPFIFNATKICKAEEMIDYVANIHPLYEDITFYTIAGNHDTSYLCMEGIDVIAKIAQLRPDIVYLGNDLADINIGGLKMRMFHGFYKKRLTVKQRITKLYDKMDDEFKPDILQLGHIHQSLYMPIDRTHIFQTGALLDDNPHDYRNPHSERSCWFVTIECDELGNIVKVTPEIQFFGFTKTLKKTK